MIISGPAEESTDKYYLIDRVIPKLQRGAVIQGDPSQEDRAAIEAKGDYTVDEKSRSVTLTETGVAKVERLLGVHNLYDPRQIDTLHHVQQALKAHAIFKRDVDYVIKDGEVIIVDEFTGRLMPGRRWSDGLHQAVEAKERVHIREENQTLATITIQNYFRMYKKLAGMTGTADTEAPEFKKFTSSMSPWCRPTATWCARTMPMWFIVRTMKNTMPWCRRSKSGTSKGSRCWSGRPRWPSRRSFRACSRRKTSSTTS